MKHMTDDEFRKWLFPPARSTASGGLGMSVAPKRYAEIHVLADSLIASCDGGMSHTDDIEALTIEECKVLDGMALECQVCNQYSAAAEMTDTGGEYVCPDCTK